MLPIDSSWQLYPIYMLFIWAQQQLDVASCCDWEVRNTDREKKGSQMSASRESLRFSQTWLAIPSTWLDSNVWWNISHGWNLQPGMMDSSHMKLDGEKISRLPGMKHQPWHDGFFLIGTDFAGKYYRYKVTCSKSKWIQGFGVFCQLQGIWYLFRTNSVLLFATTNNRSHFLKQQDPGRNKRRFHLVVSRRGTPKSSMFDHL